MHGEETVGAAGSMEAADKRMVAFTQRASGMFRRCASCGVASAALTCPRTRLSVL